MTAKEARKITHDHSNRMKEIYKEIKDSAERGNNQTCVIGHTTQAELEVLRSNGFDANYETSETDGGQFVIVKW